MKGMLEILAGVIIGLIIFIGFVYALITLLG